MITTACRKHASLHTSDHIGRKQLIPAADFGGHRPPLLETSALDLDPLVPGPRIRHSLDDAHVANAILEIGMRANAAF
jgi:hypothetical protein